MSDEQRAARSSILDQRAAGHGRLEGERTPTYQGEYMHYRDDYGASMDDSSYSTMNKGQDDFWGGVKSNKATVSENYSNLDSDYASSQSEIAAAQAEIDSSSFSFSADMDHIPTYSEMVSEKLSTGEWTTVSVYDNGTLLDVHNLPVDTANSYVSSIAAAGANGWNDEGRLGVDVEGYGAELYHPLVYAEQDEIDNYNSSYDSAVAAQNAAYDSAYNSAEASYNDQVDAANLSLSTSQESLDSSYSNAYSQIQSQETQIQAQIDANQKALDTIRNKYATKLSNVKETITGIFNARMGEDSNGS